MMRIGQAAKLAALTVDTIRFYEKQSLLPPPVRTAGRFRLYSSDDIARLRFISQMQGLGFSLREIEQLLQLRERRQDVCSEVRELLRLKLTNVRAKMRELAALERELSADLRKCNVQLKRKHAARSCPVLSSSNRSGKC